MDDGIPAPHSGVMETTETFESLVRAEFAPVGTYLNTASNGLLPARAVTALHDAAMMRAQGQPLTALWDDVEVCRAAYARLAGVPVERVALGASVAAHSAVIAASLPSGAEVLTAEDDFASVPNPFHVRGDLKVRAVPVERIAESVRPGTALVAVSAAQSADGKVADLPALREAAATHGARTYVDFSQAAGWLPMEAGEWDFTASVSYKWLLGPHGVAFLVVPEDFGGLPRCSRAGSRASGRGTAVTGPSPNSPTPPGGSTSAPPCSATPRCAAPWS